MARNRVIYQSEALYVSEDLSSTTSGKHTQLERVQSANYSFSISRQDINQYGQLARIDSLVLEPPTVSLDFSYYLTDGYNERALGFLVTAGPSQAQGNFASGHMISSSGKNFYISTVREGIDATGLANHMPESSIESVIGIGNAYLSDYTLDLAVGSLPTVSVTMEGANINSDTTLVTAGGAISGIQSPAINPQNGSILYQNGIVVLKPANSGASNISALRPGDVTVDITNFDGTGLSDLSSSSEAIHIQSASLSIPLSRSALQRLGTKFPYARAVDFPVTASLSINAIVNEITATNLANILDDQSEKDITLTLKGPDGSSNKMVYTLRGCKLDSESFSSSIGSNKTVDLTFSTQIGGPKDGLHGVFVSGANTTQPFAIV
jgi:hypothetical protein